MSGIERLSINQATVKPWTVKELVDGCARASIPWVSLWREHIAAQGVKESAQLVKDAGLKVSSLCRGGFFPAPTAGERQARIDENKRAIDEAATIEAEVLVLVCGGLPEGSKDLEEARKMVAEGLEAILPYAAERGVKLGIEPLHPMFNADRSVVTSLALANTLAERLASPYAGVVIDVYHVWWDPCVYTEIKRAAPYIFGFHVNDWIIPTPDMLLGRGMMGDGVIDLRGLRTAVDEAGYKGPIEVEIFNQSLWDTPGDEVLQTTKERYVSEVF